MQNTYEIVIAWRTAGTAGPPKRMKFIESYVNCISRGPFGPPARSAAALLLGPFRLLFPPLKKGTQNGPERPQTRRIHRVPPFPRYNTSEAPLVSRGMRKAPEAILLLLSSPLLLLLQLLLLCFCFCLTVIGTMVPSSLPSARPPRALSSARRSSPRIHAPCAHKSQAFSFPPIPFASRPRHPLPLPRSILLDLLVTWWWGWLCRLQLWRGNGGTSLLAPFGSSHSYRRL